MTIISPKPLALRDGLSIGVDGVDLGRAFYDSCGNQSCQINLQTDEKLISDFSQASIVDFEYTIAESAGNRMHVSFSGFGEGLLELRAIAGLPSEQLERSVSLEIRTGKPPLEGSSELPVGELLKTCEGGPALKHVSVNNGQIVDKQDTVGWLKSNLACNQDGKVVINLGKTADKGQMEIVGAIVKQQIAKVVPKVDLVAESEGVRLPYRLTGALFVDGPEVSPK